MKSLIFRAFGGLLVLMLILAAALFIPAGTVHYWRAWTFLLIFFISVLVITFYLMKKDQKLLERRIHAGPGAETSVTQKVIQFFAQFAFILIFIISSLDFRYAWSHVPLSISVIGDILVVCGLFVVFLVFRKNTYTSATIEVDKKQKIVSTGPYHIVRHPMYSGALIMLLGIPLALGSWWGICALIPIGIVIILRLLDEENYLKKNLRGYTEYCQKIRYRLLPYIW